MTQILLRNYRQNSQKKLNFKNHNCHVKNLQNQRAALKINEKKKIMVLTILEQQHVYFYVSISGYISAEYLKHYIRNRIIYAIQKPQSFVK